MKNGNKEVKLIYRKLNDNFFIINKPVNWVLGKRRKIDEQKNNENSYFLSDYINSLKNRIGEKNEIRGNYNESKNYDYISNLTNLSISEKNAFLYTNSPLYLYNNLNSNLFCNTNKIKNTSNIYNNIFVEKNYIESILKHDSSTHIYYPYKLPIYISGLVICCNNYLIYKKFIQMINENKLIRKYRCLVYSPFSLVDTKNSDVDSFKKNNTTFFSEENTQFITKSVNVSSNHKYEANIKNHIKCENVFQNISSLQAQKEASIIFPFYNFFDENIYSTKYLYNLIDLEINKLKDQNNNSLNYNLKDKKKSQNNEKMMIEKYFISTNLAKSSPITSLNHLTSFLLNNNNTIINNFDNNIHLENISEQVNLKKDDFSEGSKRTCFHKNELNPEPSNKTNEKNVDYDVELKNNFMKHIIDGEINFPISFFFNPGNLYFFQKKVGKNSKQFSMIYSIENYKDYLKKNKNIISSLYEQKMNKQDCPNKNRNLYNFSNIYIIDFILLDNLKTDLIRFFFSEMKTPIIYDNIFYKNFFKIDITNEIITQHIEKVIYKNVYKENLNDIFYDKYFNNSEYTYKNLMKNEDKIINEYIYMETPNPFNSFTIPFEKNPTTKTSEENKIKLNLNNYFINEQISENDTDKNRQKYNKKEESFISRNIKSYNNLCLELYQLQFIDPINNDHIIVENSLPSSWV
ncbi:conserved Plasmodium protein, unknown function [Plasmodium berghei]|uniref:Uncharacterized protein n=2 Tax=Plasmodium berghei TaxID=5821 RepID=A0A509ANP4_PLABA|nr:conserved Plasmodium protein, unknown function [Plasmodium berghei ANKA]CXI32381.1 conserved Plasmodium protein, unknown function [Plasmodium berghei]SCM21126.1 conserved Plasmodium protein, unknown function [Plasmodium berghei]SCN24477.1 conserved Plasmodium protein, unknown function [Plasmodium berghei]SCO59661.1 conserved Plasmodium protein, unknown function [Plasmodium berghei]SCO60840.1 conserved Plasmodium protein, unknown function [Plasmodium berghei]|eukprot:XP_034421137.1 conserved Plasmodium protein, unknown function [Plasmodium berghei ANKA]